MIILINFSSKLLSEAFLTIFKLNDMNDLFLIPDKTFNKNPDLIIVDYTTLNSELFNKYPDAKVVLIDTGLTKEQLISCIFEFRISGVISTDTDTKLFLKAIKVINDGQLWINNDLLKIIVDYNFRKKESAIHINLTEKEKEIIDYICKGWRNREIAEKLFLSEQTVKAHINRIFRKLQLTNRSQLVSFFLKQRH